MLRGVAFLIGVVAAVPAVAGEMTAEEARRFVVGKLFNYTCFEGTRGQGRVYSDGSVVGSVKFQGSGPVRYAHLPAGTLRVKGESVCATLRGLPFEPCFNLERTGDASFRGSISGLGFASCEFTRHQARAALAHAEHETHETNGHRRSGQPLGLRPSITAENK
jgi:hypothetical protein